MASGVALGLLSPYYPEVIVGVFGYYIVYIMLGTTSK